MGIRVAVIPAREGSKGIPWKNLRQIGHKPLIAHTIIEAKKSKLVDRVIVSTDSERIAKIAKEYGAEVPFLRPKELADDKTPLAAVMHHFLQWAKTRGWKVEALIILEPTSPLRTAQDIDNAILLFEQKQADTVVSVEKDTSLWWSKNEEGFGIPLQKSRVNRQYIKPKFKENGAIFVTKPEAVTIDTTIGEKVALYEMPPDRSIDVNTFWDLWLADITLRRVKIVFHFKASAELGFGHYYRVLSIADRLYSNNVLLLCSEYDELLEEKISSIGYQYILAKEPLEVIEREKPQILINDALDTTREFMKKARDAVPLIINFEDLGEGALLADLVFNALYEEFSIQKNHYGGSQYAILREEFLFLPKHVIREKTKLVTVTFGGTDPNNVTLHTMNALPKSFPDITFRFILGPGYAHSKQQIRKLTKNYPNVELIEDTNKMSKHLSEPDIVITSGGRTVFEAAAAGTPCIVICQNERELRHRHITSRDGVINLGLFAKDQTIQRLVTVIETIKNDAQIRSTMSEKISALVDGMGVFRIIGLIEKAARDKNIAKTL